MTDYLFFKLLHILFFVYWLGGDLGTFYASRFVARQGLSKEQRSTALTIMMGVDQGPRICMALILAPGMQMAYNLGLLTIPFSAMLAIWVLCIAWLAMVLCIHFGHGKAFVEPLTKIDFSFRVVIILLSLSVAGQSLLGEGLIKADYLSWKLIIFAALVACGLGIRVKLKPFIPAFMKMMQTGPSNEIDATLNQSLARVRPYVYLIWIGLIANAALGIHLINP
ncbi:hypothetical protein [Thalassotalea mangrovi]|uniref:DUF2269 family protein n=1 Tax=Thalassotalea mangrovi TaxID=2572245 RepID=A0A4U1B6L9_9GAMM|nr:hypothetical protein [Thalassotalea mangrovi]TKB46037.1 hypothetical protein E8M12_05260 [Thalassotalea mangrovi]